MSGIIYDPPVQPIQPVPSAPMEDEELDEKKDKPWNVSKLAEEIISATGLFIKNYPIVALGFAVVVIFCCKTPLLFILGLFFSFPKPPRSLEPPPLPDFAHTLTIIPPAIPTYDPSQPPHIPDGTTSFRVFSGGYN